MSEKLYESFRWVVPFELGTTAGKKVVIRGKALCVTVSRNARKYIVNEVEKAARSLARKYIDVNHEYSVWLSQKAAYEREEAAIPPGPKPKLKGHVIDAEEEESCIEYIGEVNHPEYFEKLVDGERLGDEEYYEKWGKRKIRHVSVDANYRFHQETNGGVEPHGIIFNGLSLVEDPEVPGVEGTSIEVLEIHETQMIEPQFKILQNYFKEFGVATEIVEKDGTKILELRKGEPLKMEKHETTQLAIQQQIEQQSDEQRAKQHFDFSDAEWEALTPEERMQYITQLPPRDPLQEQAEECPEGQRWDEEQGKCVPIIAEQEEKECPEGQQWDEEQGKCVPIEIAEQVQAEDAGIESPGQAEVPPKEEPAPEHQCPEGQRWDDTSGTCVPVEEGEAGAYVKPAAEEPTIEFPENLGELKLGEPFAGYADFDDCVAQNQQADDPEAYCASIKRQVEGETLIQKQERELKELQEKQFREQLDSRFSRLDQRLKAIEGVGKELKRIVEVLRQMKGAIEAKTGLKDMRRLEAEMKTIKTGIAKSIREVKDTLENRKDISEAVNTIEEKMDAKIAEVQDSLKGEISELKRGEEQLEEIRRMFKEYQELSKKDVEDTKTEVKDLRETLEKANVEIENLKAHAKPSFTVGAEGGSETVKPSGRFDKTIG